MQTNQAIKTNIVPFPHNLRTGDRVKHNALYASKVGYILEQTPDKFLVSFDGMRTLVAAADLTAMLEPQKVITKATPNC